MTEYLPDSGTEYMSADAIAATLVSTPADFDSVKVRAGRLFLENSQRLIQAGTDLVIEVTLAGRGFQRTIRQLKGAGYTVTIVFVFLESPELCVARVRNRVMAGGHHVPAEDIVRRFYRSKRNFWRVYKNLAHEWGLFYNSGDSLQQVAAGEGDDFTVANDEFFELFLVDIDKESVK